MTEEQQAKLCLYSFHNFKKAEIMKEISDHNATTIRSKGYILHHNVMTQSRHERESKVKPLSQEHVDNLGPPPKSHDKLMVLLVIELKLET